MPADPIHPDQLDGQVRFRADLVAYLDSLPIGELAELLGELPRSRQEPLGQLVASQSGQTTPLKCGWSTRRRFVPFDRLVPHHGVALLALGGGRSVRDESRR